MDESYNREHVAEGGQAQPQADNQNADATTGEADIGTRSRILEIKEAELALREQEVKLKEQQSQRSRWRDPVFLGIVAALIGFMSSVASTFFQGRTNAQAENLKFQSNLILEAIKTGDPAKAATNLSFFVQLGFIDDPKNKIRDFLAHRNETPVLPSPVSAPITTKSFFSVQALDSKSRERIASTPVGFLRLNEFAGQGFLCTAWLVANNRIVTADYCVKQMVPSDLTFRVGYVSSSTRGESFKISEIIETNSEAGFALLETEGSPGTIYGVMKLANRTPAVGESLVVLHHPEGRELSISGLVSQCRVIAVTGVDFHHDCDTAPGSGGAPIVSRRDFSVLGIVYSGGPGGEMAKSISRSSVDRTH